MSRKTNKLRRRVEIAEHARRKDRQTLINWERQLQVQQSRLERDRSEFLRDRANLDRSIVLRMRVQREFDRPYGSMYALNIVLYPDEFARDFRHQGRNSIRLQDAGYYASHTGHEAGLQITEVIRRCIAGELEEFERAK